jgi:ankyrin repeat protein
MNREFLKRVMTKILNRMKSELPNDERFQLINESDQYGGSLIHYVTALDYSELIVLLYEHGANLKAGSKITPLVIAAGKGYEKCVKKLIRLGAAFWRDDDDEEC